MLKNIDPLIFSNIKVTGNLWAGAAGTGSYSATVNASSVTLKDTVTGETLFKTNVSGGAGYPFSLSIPLDKYVNPVDLYANLSITLGQNGAGECYIGNIYCKIR